MDLRKISLLVEATTDEIYTKYYSDVPREEFDKIIALDPTYNKEQNRMGDFGKWLLAIHKKGADLSDEQELKDQLLIFKRNKNKLSPEQKDIFRLKSLEDLIELNDAVEKANKSELQTKAEQHPGANFICKSDKWEVYEPTTYDASKWLRGDDAVWCTGRHDDTYHWKDYTKDGGRLFIFINMDKENANEKTVKYQVAVTKDNRVREFRDARNNSADFALFINDDGLFKALSNTDIAKTPEYKAVAEFKENKGVITYSKLMAIKYSGGSVSSLYKLLSQEVKVIIVNDGISYISVDAFSGMGVQKIKLPDSIRQIGERAFADCKNLKEIKIPPKVTTIPKQCFSGCQSLKTAEFGVNVIEFKQEAFAETPDDLKLITPTHRMRIPMSEKGWYEKHISRLPKQEENLKEDFEGKVPEWLKPFLVKKSRKPYGGYKSDSNLGNILNSHNPYIDFNKVEFKPVAKPQTKADLIALLNDKSKLPVFYIPINKENSKLYDTLNNKNNYTGVVDSDIIYIPGITDPAIGYYSDDKMSKLSKQKLFDLLKKAKDVKIVYIDKNNNDNFDSKRIDRRQNNTLGLYDRVPTMGQQYTIRGKWVLEPKPEVLDKLSNGRKLYPIYYDTKEEAETKLQLSSWTKLDGMNWPEYIPNTELFDLKRNTTPEVIDNMRGYDLSGYQIQKIKNKNAERLNDYRKEHYSETLDKITAEIETCKTKIQELFSSSLSDSDSINVFNNILSIFRNCLSGYNKLISNLDFILMLDDEEKKKDLLNQVFAYDSSSSSLKPTVRTIIGDIKELKKQLSEVETTYIESLNKK